MSVHVMFPRYDGMYRVSWELADFLSDAMQDFTIRYGCIQSSPYVLRRLRRAAAAGNQDAELARRMLEELEKDGAVEVFVSA